MPALVAGIHVIPQTEAVDGQDDARS